MADVRGLRGTGQEDIVNHAEEAEWDVRLRGRRMLVKVLAQQVWAVRAHLCVGTSIPVYGALSRCCNFPSRRLLERLDPSVVTVKENAKSCCWAGPRTKKQAGQVPKHTRKLCMKRVGADCRPEVGPGERVTPTASTPSSDRSTSTLGEGQGRRVWGGRGGAQRKFLPFTGAPIPTQETPGPAGPEPEPEGASQPRRTTQRDRDGGWRGR